MKNAIRFLCLTLCAGGLIACATNQAKQTTEENNDTPRRKIYLTEQDYMDDLADVAQAGRREAKPNTESDYIFEVQPPTQKNVYFFDERNRPLVPGEIAEQDYKNVKRLWEKPRRYSPAEYYGNQPTAAPEEAAPTDDDFEW